ncbi:kinase-like domain-containing protein, partial [Sordaria sp. MPI-SDFR-AT-0083]
MLKSRAGLPIRGGSSYLILDFLLDSVSWCHTWLRGEMFENRDGFLHRDLKPRNILVAEKEPTWHVKVADFGIAKNLFDNNSFFTHYIGTRGCIAPKIFQPMEISYTAVLDVWALGAVVYCMLTGASPFETLDE